MAIVVGSFSCRICVDLTSQHCCFFMTTVIIMLERFLQDGVGDTTYSFAFDGSRIQKWNMKMHSKYGEVCLHSFSSFFISHRIFLCIPTVRHLAKQCSKLGIHYTVKCSLSVCQSARQSVSPVNESDAYIYVVAMCCFH